jgi:adenylosuccinate lyase
VLPCTRTDTDAELVGRWRRPGSAGKIGFDIALAQTEVGEERRRHGGSSTLPQKWNPVRLTSTGDAQP